MQSNLKIFLIIIYFIVIVFGIYLIVSLFDLWAFLPFWLKNLALGLSLGATYLLSRKTILNHRNNAGPLSAFKWGLPLTSSLVLVMLIWTGSTIGAGLPGRILQAMTFNLTQPPREILLTVNVNPPAYLNQRAITIFDEKNGPVLGSVKQNNLKLPEGSMISITVEGAKNYAPFVSLGNTLGKNRLRDNGVYETQHVIQDNATLDIKVGPYISFQQEFSVVPDHAPVIRVTADPEVTTRMSLEFQIAFSDDHGITESYFELSPRGVQGREQDIIRLPVSSGVNGEENQTVFLNLLSHQWAGTTVTGRVRAIDGLGQVSESEKITLSLPEKSFLNPVAQSLASIRKSLLITPERKNAQVRRLDILTNDRNAYQNDISIYLSLRSAYWKLRSAETTGDLREVTRYLWQTALKIEGDGSFEEQNIQSLIKQIRADLATGENISTIDARLGALRARMEDIVDREYLLLSRRMTMNEDLQETKLPGFIIFNTLIGTLRKQVNEGKIVAAGKTLTTFQALFEKRPAPPLQ